jgi:putative PIN family toxin of toxin-antitoxin system
MNHRTRVVVDTNVLISGVLKPGSVPGHAYAKARDFGQLVFNESLLKEIESVIVRPKFDRYLTGRARALYLAQLKESVLMVPTIIRVSACRDPRDNHVLEAAVNGSADLIVTGDEDLLALNPFHDVRILTAIDFLRL